MNHDAELITGLIAVASLLLLMQLLIFVLLFLNHLKLTRVMNNLEQFNAVLGRIDDATTNIAADIRNLKDQIGTGLTQEEVNQLKNQLEQKASQLEQIAADTEDPVPGNLDVSSNTTATPGANAGNSEGSGSTGGSPSANG